MRVFFFLLLNSDFPLWTGTFRHLITLYTMWLTESIFILFRAVLNCEKNLLCDLMGIWYLTKQEYILNHILAHRYLCKVTVSRFFFLHAKSRYETNLRQNARVLLRGKLLWYTTEDALRKPGISLTDSLLISHLVLYKLNIALSILFYLDVPRVFWAFMCLFILLILSALLKIMGF